ncbi:MFS transporter [Halorubrum pallidum]
MGYVSTAASVVRDLRSEGRGRILVVVAFGWFLSISVRMVYPALLPYIRETYGLTLTTAGLLLTVLWTAYALGQLPAGILGDWLGDRPLLVASQLLAAAMLALVVIADSAAVLYAATALFGGATALYGVSRFTVLETVYSDNLGTATGVTMAAGDVGNAVMPPAAGFIAAALTWQYGFGVAVPLFLVAAVGLWLVLPRPTATEPSLRDAIPVEDVIATLSRPAVRRGTLLLVLWAVIIQAFMGFYPTYLIEQKAVPRRTATVLFGFFFSLGMVWKPIAGRAYDRIGIRRPLLVIAGAAGAAFVALPLVEGIRAFIPVTVLASGLLGFETVVVSDLTNRLPDGTRGTSLGALRTVYLAFGAASPAVFGAVADAGYFDEAFFAVAVVAGGVAVVALRVDGD